jgi:hypothetical protein
MWFHAHVPALMARRQVSGWVAETQSSSVAETQLEGESSTPGQQRQQLLTSMNEHTIGRGCACRVDGANREPVEARMQQHCRTGERSRVRTTSSMVVANERPHGDTIQTARQGKEVCTVGAMQLVACGNLT